MKKSRRESSRSLNFFFNFTQYVKTYPFQVLTAVFVLQTVVTKAIGFGSPLDLSSLNGEDGFILRGVNSGDLTGTSVNAAGDLNGDGVGDLIIASISCMEAVNSYVLFESNSSVNLSELNGDNGFFIKGAAIGGSGHSVSTAGDVNGDGYDDVIIGAACADPNGKSYAGESYVIFGSPQLGKSGIFNLDDLDGSNGFTLMGNDWGDSSGGSVSFAGDVNGDGYADIIIGAPDAGSSHTGESYVVFGSPTIGNNITVSFSSLNGTTGFVIEGINAGDQSGYSVNYAGDVNGDGYGDIILGAPDADPNQLSYAGETYVILGNSTIGKSGVISLNTLNGFNGFVLPGIISESNSGYSVSFAGDVNGDGCDDIIIGAPAISASGVAGRCYVIFGRPNIGEEGLINLSNLNGSNGFTLIGIEGDISGSSVSTARDVNGDGYDDVIVGAPSFSAGVSYVVFGGAEVGKDGVFYLDSLDGVNGLILEGAHSSDGVGSSVAPAGDVNRDGYADFILGAPFANSDGQNDVGEVYVVFGAPVFTQSPTPMPTYYPSPQPSVNPSSEPSLAPTPLFFPTPAPHHHNNHLMQTVIAGILGGVVGGVTIVSLLWLGFYCRKRFSERNAGDYKKIESGEVTEKNCFFFFSKKFQELFGGNVSTPSHDHS